MTTPPFFTPPEQIVAYLRRSNRAGYIWVRDNRTGELTKRPLGSELATEWDNNEEEA